ncbi:hypothetical protein MSM1_19985 [Mycobacterium sp. SM1]|uniref:hypothetical protein n=1 Tax=Mycobacterium sp. SM1 TaxID=2816243 RepID=UPI001BD0A919|nr:hypothetical protein [Mycobacterium sp. SM1]MBS4729857.1 hypothetical protein [Mycobacterium sp. SM1]MBS4730504.1 hypothetical protein [Mycobacterium sp. SM1]
MTNDDLTPRPALAAWQPMTADDRQMVQWIAANTDNAEYARRVLFIPQQRDLRYASAAIRAFGAAGNVGSSRSPHVNRGGPVLAYRPDLRQLGRAVAAAESQVLGVIEFAEGEVAGWAAATNAVDLTTGEPTVGVPDDVHAALAELHTAGYNGYSRDREQYFAAHYFPPIDVLLEAGYPYAFVASYLVALGAHGDSVGDDLKRIYVPPAQRRRARRG